MKQTGLFPQAEPRAEARPFARVAPEAPVGGPFTYLVPPELDARAQAGVRVRVPFGGRSLRGFLLERTEENEAGGRRLKPLAAVLDEEPVVTPEVLRLARFAADYYQASLGEVLAAAVPQGVGAAPARPDPERLWVRRTEKEGTGRLGAAQRRALDALREGPRPYADLRALGVAPAVLRRLEERGLVAVEERGPEAGPRDEPPTLTAEQDLVLRPLLAQIDEPRHATTLLYGVTGSGKTEVYLRAIERALACGRSAIVLVPEIALTPQTVARFRARFGERVALLHSQQRTRDRRREWSRVRRGEAQVVVGPRSAVWAPVRDLGLVVVDEEHEATYKQENAPRYHARDLAVVRGKQAGVPVLLGSATPSLESWQNARSGRYRLARLLERPGGRSLPTVHVVDMGQEWSEVRGAPLLSRLLLRELRTALERGEQALIFQNRRGFTTYLMCPGCGHVLTCRQCDITLTYHRGLGATVCHFCDARQPPPGSSCPECLGPPLRQRGAGTERIEALLAELLPGARVARLDTDVVRGGASPEEVLARFRAGEVDVLVGTQMIAKGLDIARVTVVGVVSADTALNLPDVRAAERTFQLISQVAGRAGRGERAGTTIVQSFLPRHYAIEAAAKHCFEDFARRELQAREALAYPPFARLLKVLVRGARAEAVEEEAERLAGLLRRPELDGVLAVLGPAPSPRAYLAGKHRWQLLVKGTHPGLRRALRRLAGARTPSGLERVVDVDPYHLL
ncbi:MAG: primosomal protein N' [Planctomycetota bacterium]|nr:MAG: primosomal protein N' [Planctomycetota bacterium]